MSDDFDPDAYLAEKKGEDSSFDPDAYLGTKKAKAPVNTAPPDTSAKDNAALTKGAGQTFVSRALDSALLGFGDKAQSALYAAINDDHDRAPFWQRYSEALKRADEVNANSADAHPVADIGGKIVGGLATAPLIPGGPAKSFLGAAGKGAAFGAGSAALNSVGADRSGDLGTIAKNAGKSAVLGGVAGGVIGGGVYGASKGIGAVKNYIQGRLADTVNKEKDGVIRSVSDRLGKEEMPADFVDGIARREEQGLTSWDPEPKAEKLPEGALESTSARQARMAAKVGRDVRQAHAILANPSAFSEEEVAAARAVADKMPAGFRGMPNPRAAAKNVQASAVGENTRPMTSAELRGNMGSSPSQPPPPPADALWVGDEGSSLPRLKADSPYAKARVFDEPFGTEPETLAPKVDPSSMKNDPSAATNALPGRSYTPPEQRILPGWREGNTITPDTLGTGPKGVDAIARDFEFGQAVKHDPYALGQNLETGAPAGMEPNFGPGTAGDVAKSVAKNAIIGKIPFAKSLGLKSESLLDSAVSGSPNAGTRIGNASELSRQAEKFLNSIDPQQQMYGRILLKAAQAESPKAAAAITKDSGKPGHPDDNRNF